MQITQQISEDCRICFINNKNSNRIKLLNLQKIQAKQVN